MQSLQARGSVSSIARTLAITVTVMSLFLSFSGRVGAEAKYDVSAAGTVHVLACQGGGSAMVDEDRTGAGLQSVTVTCAGGAFDGLSCTSTASTGTTDCTHTNRTFQGVPKIKPQGGKQR